MNTKKPTTLSTIRESTMRKYKAIQRRFRHLYDVERLRIDDVEQQLCDEYFLSRHQIMYILNLDLDL